MAALAISAGTSPAEDPTFLAFLRSMGAEESDLRGEVDYRTSQLRRAARRRLPHFQAELEAGQEGIAGAYEDRGFLNSGARHVAQTRQRQDVMRNQGDFLAETGDRISDLNYSAARGIAKLRRDEVESAYGARERLALANFSTYGGLV